MQLRRVMPSLLVLVVLLASCTSQAAVPATGGSASRATGELGLTRVNGGSHLRVTVAGTKQDPLIVDVQPGDFAGDGTIGTVSSKEPAPSKPWFVSAGQVREIAVTGRMVAPVTLSFAAGSTHADEIPLVWRKDAQMGWYPIAVGDAGGTATAQRTRFSPHLPGWVNPSNWLNASGRWARGRTTPPSCGAAPSWADLTAPALDILLTCVATNLKGGVARVELKVRNNRGLTQAIDVPSGVSYANVEGQSEPLRALIRTIAGGRDVVLLPPGSELRIGFKRPGADQRVTVTPTLTALALATELLLQLADLAEEQGSMAVLPALLGVAGCAGLKSELTSGVVPDSASSVKDLAWSLLKCAEALADPHTAVVVAEHVVAVGAKVPLVIVQSDAAFRGRVEQASGKLQLLGKASRVLKAVEVAKYAGIVWESVAEQLGRAMVDLDPATATLAMRALPTLCGGIADCHVVGHADLDGDGRTDDIAVIGHADQPENLQWTSSNHPTLRVKTNTGIVIYPVQVDGWAYQPLYGGAASVDAQPGKEIIVGHTAGAHSRSYTMLTMRRGKLIALPAPDNTGRGGDWMVDGSSSSNATYRCLGNGVVESASAVIREPPPDASTNTYDTRTQRYSRTNGTWRLDGPERLKPQTFPLGIEMPAPFAGWQCTGFSRF